MQAYLADGLSAAEAARAALTADASTPPGRPAGRPSPRLRGMGCPPRCGRLWTLSTKPPRRPCSTGCSPICPCRPSADVVLPYLADLGRRWQRGTASVAMEHFAAMSSAAGLAGLARRCGSGHGPQALLACPPGELHDIALMVFGIVLHRNGRRIGYLGPSTPVEELERGVDAGVLAWSSWPLPVRRPSSRSPRSSPHWPGAARSPSPEPRHSSDRDCGRGPVDGRRTR